MSESKWVWFVGLAAFGGCGCGGSGGGSHLSVPERIFFVKEDAGGDKEIHSMNIDGGDLQQITHNDSDDDTPVGCRINRKIYYSSLTPSPGIYEMNDDGTEIRFVCAADPSTYHIQDITPNGKFLVVVHDLGGGKSRIEFLSTVQGTLDHTIGFDNARNDSPSVRIDGKSILFVSDKDGTNDVWMASISGGNLKRQTHGFNDSVPAWSSPGTSISGWLVYFFRSGFVNAKAPESSGSSEFWHTGGAVLGRMHAGRTGNEVITTLTAGGHSDLHRQNIGAGVTINLPITPTEDETSPFWR